MAQPEWGLDAIAAKCKERAIRPSLVAAFVVEVGSNLRATPRQENAGHPSGSPQACESEVGRGHQRAIRPGGTSDEHNHGGSPAFRDWRADRGRDCGTGRGLA